MLISCAPTDQLLMSAKPYNIKNIHTTDLTPGFLLLSFHPQRVHLRLPTFIKRLQKSSQSRNLKNELDSSCNPAFPPPSAALSRSQLHLICDQHRQQRPERRHDPRGGALGVPPPQGVHAGHRQPVEGVHAGREQPAEGDQHRHIRGARLHPQSGRGLGPAARPATKHLRW